MKTIFTVICLLIATHAFATEQELSIQTGADGQPSFGIQYAYDSDVAFTFTYTTTISNQSLTALPNVIFWTVVDLNANKAIADWSQISKADLLVGSIGISSKPSIAILLPKLKTVKIVFGSKNAQGNVEALFSIPVGPLCQNFPDHFTDLTHPSKAACTVTAEDIPDWKNQCTQYETQFLGYVKQGLLTCAVAKQQYAKRGCGDLGCQ